LNIYFYFTLIFKLNFIFFIFLKYEYCNFYLAHGFNLAYLAYLDRRYYSYFV